MTQAISTSALGSVKGKNSGRKRSGQILVEHLAGEDGQHPFEVGEGDVLVDEKTFDLMEHRGMGDIRVAAVDLARGDDPQGRLRASMMRACIGEVWVRSSTESLI
jgi:hypothetical protein